MMEYIDILKMIRDSPLPHKKLRVRLRGDFGSFITDATAKGHIRNSKLPDGDHAFELTPTGREFLRKGLTEKKESMKKWYRKPEWWAIIVAIIIALVGLFT